MQSKLSVLMPSFITLAENFGNDDLVLNLLRGAQGPEISLRAAPLGTAPESSMTESCFLSLIHVTLSSASEIIGLTDQHF